MQTLNEKETKVCTWKPFACNLVLAMVPSVLNMLHMHNAETHVAYDADLLRPLLHVRPWTPGDTLTPFGLKGHKTLGNLFTDAKIPAPVRAYWPVVVHGDTVVWVPGLRRAAVAPITPKTKRVCTIHLEGTLPSRHMLSAASGSIGC
jgi:tRNA(Ile)-lysidine synthetase-like protein